MPAYEDNVFINVPQQARDLRLDARELTFGDYTHLVVGWLLETPW